jgi:hypothetical protein
MSIDQIAGKLSRLGLLGVEVTGWSTKSRRVNGDSRPLIQHRKSPLPSQRAFMVTTTRRTQIVPIVHAHRHLPRL